MDLEPGGAWVYYRVLQIRVTTNVVAAVSDRRVFGAQRAPLQKTNVTLFCNPH